jgi:penicillin-binding protein 2
MVDPAKAGAQQRSTGGPTANDHPGRLETHLALKKIVFLIATLALVLGGSLGAGPPAETSRKPTSKKQSTARPHRKAQERTASTHRTRRRRRYNPWKVSSFGNSAADDDPTGEDPVVRTAALEGLGQWNGAVVVVDPATGRILTIVNQKLAFSQAYTPCSTFKPIVAFGALKEGLITTDTFLRVGRHSQINLTEALAHSNNVFFAKVGEMLGFDRVSAYAHEFGLGEKAGWNIPEEEPGYFPSDPPGLPIGYLTSYGHDIGATVLQMAAVASAFANGGTLYYLQYPRSPEAAAEFQPKVRRKLDGFDEYFPYLKQGLAAAVIYGTARKAYDPEEQILGKTGTCSEDGARLGWFVSYADEEKPRFVVVVLLRGGRPTSGPHSAEIAGRIYRDLRVHTQNAERAMATLPLASAVPAR